MNVLYNKCYWLWECCGVLGQDNSPYWICMIVVCEWVMVAGRADGTDTHVCNYYLIIESGRSCRCNWTVIVLMTMLSLVFCCFASYPLALVFQVCLSWHSLHFFEAQCLRFQEKAVCSDIRWVLLPSCAEAVVVMPASPKVFSSVLFLPPSETAGFSRKRQIRRVWFPAAGRPLSTSKQRDSLLSYALHFLQQNIPPNVLRSGKAARKESSLRLPWEKCKKSTRRMRGLLKGFML